MLPAVVPGGAGDPSYVAHLNSLPLSLLLQEPTSLASSESQLTASLTALCHAQYPTFLLAHDASSTLKSTLSSLQDTLEKLTLSLPPLREQCLSFSVSTQPVLADRRSASLLLEHHDKLLDLLELPQLLTTCIVNSNYQEALDLIVHSEALAKRFPDVQIVRDVHAEVEHATRVMAAQLLGVLREPVKLPALFRAVNFLRRMGELAEEELALAFLTSRLAYFDSAAAAVEEKEKGVEVNGEDHARYLRKYVDLFRESAYDVVTQFTTIFLERSPELHQDLHYLLASFTHHLVSRLASVLETTLTSPAVLPSPSTLASLLTHLSYTATSLSRLGLDFRSILSPPISSSILIRTRIALETATSEFTRELSRQRSPQPWLITSSALTLLLAGGDEPKPPSLQGPLHVPPHSLTAYPLIATYANALLGTLNNLRLLAPSHLLGALHGLLAHSLRSCGAALFAFVEERLDPRRPEGRVGRASLDSDGGASASEDWNVVGRAVMREFATVLVPYAERSLVEGVFGAHGTSVSGSLNGNGTHAESESEGEVETALPPEEEGGAEDSQVLQPEDLAGAREVNDLKRATIEWESWLARS